MIAGVSGGVEPLFGLVFQRNVMDGVQMFEVNPIFEKLAKEQGFYSEELMEIISEKGTVHGIKGVPAEIQHVFSTAHDVSPEWHVKMQAAFQLHTDNAVSKTVNFTEEATRQDIEKTYHLAHEFRLKGITVYRNNSRQFQPMNIEKKTTQDEPVETIQELDFENQELKKLTCTECSTVIEFGEGCFICLGCGYSGCS